MNGENSPDERFELEETLLQRLRRHERELSVTRSLTKAKVVTADAEVQQLEEKVRAVVENGKRVGAKVDALVELMQQRLRRDGGGTTS